MADFNPINLLKGPGTGITEARIKAYQNNSDDIKETASGIFDTFKEKSSEKGIFQFGTMGLQISTWQTLNENKEEIFNTGKNIVSDVGEGIKDWYTESTICGMILDQLFGQN